MKPQADNNSRSLRLQADGLEQKLECRQQRLRVRISGIKHAVISKLTSPATLLAAFGIGVALEQTSHRRKGSLAYMLNAGYTGARLLATLLSTMRAANRSYRESSPDHVQPD